jgi:hypothetical protein
MKYMYTIAILNMSHWWFSHTNINTCIMKYYTYTWCASKYLEIMQDHHAGSDCIIVFIHLLYCPSFFLSFL